MERWNWEPFRKKYRFELDESYQHEGDTAYKRENKRFYERISLRGGGFIGLHDENPIILYLWTPNRSPTVLNIYRKFQDVPGFRYGVLDGYEAGLYFPATHLREVASLAGARTKRQMTEEQRRQAIERLSRQQFRKNHAYKTNGDFAVERS